MKRVTFYYRWLLNRGDYIWNVDYKTTTCSQPISITENSTLKKVKIKLKLEVHSFDKLIAY